MDNARDRDELQRFIQGIPLPQLLEDNGWELDRRESSRNAMKYRAGNDVLIVGQKEGRWVYFNPQNKEDNGTIVNFGLNHIDSNLGHVRQMLRTYLGESQHWSPPRNLMTSPTAGEREEKTDVRSEWKNLPPLQGKASDYLQARDLRPETLQTYVRSIRTERIKHHENIAFAHVRFLEDQNVFQISGWERKGPGRDGKSFSGFSGNKGIAVFAHKERDSNQPTGQIHLCEASIDALSKAQLDELPRQDFYVSLGGGWGRETERALTALIERQQPQGIVIGLDADETGRTKSAELQSLLTQHRDSNGKNYEILTVFPEGAKDWNELLQQFSGQPHLQTFKVETIDQTQEDVIATIRDMHTGKLHVSAVGLPLPGTSDVHILGLDFEQQNLLLSSGGEIKTGTLYAPDEQEKQGVFVETFPAQPFPDLEEDVENNLEI